MCSPRGDSRRVWRYGVRHSIRVFETLTRSLSMAPAPHSISQISKLRSAVAEMPSPNGPYLDTCDDVPGGMQLGSNRVNAHPLCWGHEAAAHMNSGLRAGGTGIEPATCGFGDPIRRVGWRRAMSPETALPHSLCRLMSPHVAVCRRSLGHILGQRMLPQALFFLLKVADRRPYT
jgi:hypothetical protein